MLKHLETAQLSKLSKALDCVALRPVSATTFVIQYTNSVVMKCGGSASPCTYKQEGFQRELVEIGGGEWCKNLLAKLDWCLCNFMHMSASPFVGKSWSVFNACRPRLRFANAWSKCLHSTQQDMTNLALLLHHGQKTLLSQMICLTHWNSPRQNWLTKPIGKATYHLEMRSTHRGTGGTPLQLCSHLMYIIHVYTCIHT